jgi:hypothetical protein
MGVMTVCREKEIDGVEGMRFDCIQTSIQMRFVVRKRSKIFHESDLGGEKGNRSGLSR